MLRKQKIAGAIIAGIVMVSVPVTGTAAECELKGVNLFNAYNKAVNNGNKFGCWIRVNKRDSWKKDNTFRAMPHALFCQHISETSVWTKIAGMVNNVGSKITGQKAEFNIYHSMSFFRTGLKNGWKISRYSVSGGGTKKNTSGKRILFESRKDAMKNWKISLNRMWIKKNGANCSNINSVITNAFGD